MEPLPDTQSLFTSSRPLWLSPRQVMFVPVNPTCEDYAKKVSPAPRSDPPPTQTRGSIKWSCVFVSLWSVSQLGRRHDSVMHSWMDSCSLLQLLNEKE